MENLKDICRIAVVQAAPVMFDRDACVDKVLRYIDECAANGAELIVFPELFIPGYPYGMTFGFTVGSRKADGRKDWKQYYDNSVTAKGPEMQRIIERAVEKGVYVSLGYSERDTVTATLYNSNLMIAPDGTVVNHRKLKPTGNLICWESYMPLARVALYQKGVTIYISPNTNDNEEWQNTIRHIAIEGHCYFVNCDMYFTRDMYPETAGAAAEIAALPEIVCRGGSSVIDPYGHAVTETLWDCEGVLYADLDMQKVPASRMEHDVCGHYARPDVLDLRVREG